MKKLLFIVSFIFIICACTKSQPEATPKELPQEIESSCKIGNYDCWDIIQDIKRLSNSEEEASSALEKKGLSIIRTAIYGDGGSLGYTLSNGVSVFINNGNGTRGYATITDPNSQKKITYDNEGKIINNIFTESSCKMGKYDCWDIIKDIKNETHITSVPDREEKHGTARIRRPAREKAFNSALEKKGLSIIEYYHIKDFYKSYILSNGIEIFMSDDTSSQTRVKQGYTIIREPVSYKKIIYNNKGNITNTKNVITESSCKIGAYDCWDIIKDIKQLSNSNQEATSALEKKGILIAEIGEGDYDLFYTLSNGVDIIVPHKCQRTDSCGHITITDRMIPIAITYDNEGNIVKQKKPNNVFSESSCKVDEYDCWDIIQDIQKESKKSASKEKATNPALEKKGLSISRYRKFDDGGSEGYLLSNQVVVFVDHKTSSKTQGYITIVEPDNDTEITYDPNGNIVKYVEQNVSGDIRLVSIFRTYVKYL